LVRRPLERELETCAGNNPNRICVNLLLGQGTSFSPAKCFNFENG